MSNNFLLDLLNILTILDGQNISLKNDQTSEIKLPCPGLIQKQVCNTEGGLFSATP